MEEISQTNETFDGCFIFLHGATRTGNWQRRMFQQLSGNKFKFKNVKVIFPTAPTRYFELYGTESHIWFNVRESNKGLIPDSHLPHINESAESLKEIIAQLEKEGVPINRIVIGGISQGAMLAIHAVYRYYPEVAGCIGVSMMVPYQNLVFEAVKRRMNNPPLLLCHGRKDAVIPLKMGHAVYQNLKTLGVPVEFQEFSEGPHEIIREEIEAIQKWISDLLPEK